MDDAIENQMEQRLGRLHAKQCLGIKKDHEAQIPVRESISSTLRTGTQFIRLFENIKLGGIHWRVRRNPERVRVGHNYARFERLPCAFDGLTLLHISYLHVECDPTAGRATARFEIRHVRDNGRPSRRDIWTVCDASRATSVSY
jgi:hypothetical protein